VTLIGWILDKIGVVVDEVAIVEVPREVDELGRSEGAKVHVSFVVALPVGVRRGRWMEANPGEIQ
jgi:hypothetical protein